MLIRNSGTVDFDIPEGVNPNKVMTTAEAIIGDCSSPNDFGNMFVTVTPSGIEFDEYLAVNLEDTLNQIAKELRTMGVGMKNCDISYYGDYDGFIIIENDEFVSYGEDWRQLKKADDSLLIQELKLRGYSVVYKEKT